MEVTTRPANTRPSPEDSPKPKAPSRLVVGIATTQHRDVLTGSVRHIAGQTRLPDLVILSVVQERDIDRAALTDLPFPIRVLVGPNGPTRQRNRILESLEPADILAFIEDDFLMAPDYLFNLFELFRSNPDIVGATGRVIADGVIGTGYDHESGLELLEDVSAPQAPTQLHDVYSSHGGNMALRARPVLHHDVTFDETLPLCSWMEDVDFSRKLARLGRLVSSDHLVGVHLGTGTGHPPGRPLGYSQIINPLYMLKTGSVSAGRALRLAGGVLASNLIRSILSDDRKERRGRLAGNFRAIGDIVRGRIDPQRARRI